MPKRKELLNVAALFLIIGWIYLNLATYNTYRFFEPEALGTVFDAHSMRRLNRSWRAMSTSEVDQRLRSYVRMMR